MLDQLKDFLNDRLFKKDAKSRGIFAINEGSFKGEFFVYIRETEEYYHFLSLPHNNPVAVPVEEFKIGVDKKIIEPLEKLPTKVYEICVAQYNEAKAKDNINRLKQSAASSGVDKRKSKNPS